LILKPFNNGTAFNENRKNRVICTPEDNNSKWPVRCAL